MSRLQCRSAAPGKVPGSQMTAAFRARFDPWCPLSANSSSCLHSPWLVRILFLGTQVVSPARNTDLCHPAKLSLPSPSELAWEVVGVICGVQGGCPCSRQLQQADDLHVLSGCFSFTDSSRGTCADCAAGSSVLHSRSHCAESCRSHTSLAGGILLR